MTIESNSKQKIMVQLDKDSKLLAKFKLIDYSIFILEVNRTKMFINNEQKKEPIVKFDSIT